MGNEWDDREYVLGSCVVQLKKYGMNTQWQVMYYISASGDIPVRDFLDAAGPMQKTPEKEIALTMKRLRAYGGS